jgi:tetratricopeptide (TPR) repeat protein
VQHYFISYSRADGEELAARLAEALAPLPVWRDAQIRAGDTWPRALDQAIAESRAVLFVMTPDSVRSSFCELEWSRALLTYKKPVVPLLAERGVVPPFLLGLRQYVDFTAPFDSAVAQLREHLEWLDTPAGELYLVEQRIEDAEGRLAHADAAGAAEELAELRRQREGLRRKVENPEAAKHRVQAGVAKDLERVRIEGIHPPPMTVPPHFQNRDAETAQVEAFLQDESLRLMVVAGRGGIGKSALVCRVLRDLPRVVYPPRVSLPDLYTSLLQLLPEDAAARVDAVYRDPSSSARQTMETLAQAFGRTRTIVLLDHFESAPPDLDEALRALLELPPHGMKMILTARLVPRELLLVHPERAQRLDLDEGLEAPHAEAMLRAMDRDGKLGLRDAPDALLATARERTRGHPRALEHLTGILKGDRDTTLEEILESTRGLLPESVVNVLVGEAFSRLDPLAQRVMQALAVYRTPVPAGAVDHLLEVETAPVLSRLVNMYFAEGERKRYWLQPLEREYALRRIDAPSLRELRLGAAEWFGGARKAQEAWKSLDDLAPQLAEIDLRYDAGDYDTAATVLLEITQPLALWGHYTLTVDHYRRLQGKIADPEIATTSMAVLGGALIPLGRIDEATALYERAIAEARRHDLPSEAVMLVDLASIKVSRFELAAAIELLGRANTRMMELEQYYGVSHVTMLQANVLLQVGKADDARDRLNDALTLVRELEDRQSEAAYLCALAAVQVSIGDLDDAMDSCERAVAIASALGYRQGIASARTFMAMTDMLREQWAEAERAIDEALAIADELELLQMQKLARETAAMIALHRNELARAHALCEAAGRYETGPAPLSSALRGIIAVRQHDLAAARQSFQQAIAEANQLLAITPQLYLAHVAVGLAYCGLAVCGDRGKAAGAQGAFANARRITAHAGNVRMILQLFDALAQADTDGILAEVRPFVTGTAA